MAENSEPAFLVDAYSDPIVIKVNGRASYVNSMPLSEFFGSMLGRGKAHFVIDFADCSGMDSTFLGIIAGAALELAECNGEGAIVLCRLSRRNLELVRNLGLHRIATVDSGDYPMYFDTPDEALKAAQEDEIASARMILNAHENLVEIDEANQAKFRDVIAFLKNQAESG